MHNDGLLELQELGEAVSYLALTHFHAADSRVQSLLRLSPCARVSPRVRGLRRQR